MPCFRQLFTLLLFLSGGVAFAEDASRPLRGEPVEACDQPLLPAEPGSNYASLRDFVAREGRLPEPSRGKEIRLYRSLYRAVKSAGPEAFALSQPTVALLRRETAYRNTFLALVAQLEREPFAALPATPRRQAELFRTWGDDPRPADPREEFISLLQAQAEWRDHEGRRVLEGLDPFVARHGRLPTGTTDKLLMDRLRFLLSRYDPAILQLGAGARALVRGTVQYQHRAAELRREWKQTSAPPAQLRFRATLWRLFGG